MIIIDRIFLYHLLRFQLDPVLPICCCDDPALELIPVGLLSSGVLPPMAPLFGGDVPLSICVKISLVYLSLNSENALTSWPSRHF